MYKCKICNKDFKQRHSLAAHYSSSHSKRPKKDRITLTKICKCGKSFTVECKIGREHKTRQYCSRKCSNSRQIDDSKKKTLNCYKCNKPVVVGLRASKVKCDKCRSIQRQSRIVKEKRIRVSKRTYYDFICKQCNNQFQSTRKDTKFCCRHCQSIFVGRLGGIKSSAKKIKRSKNETLFFELCKLKFSNVLHNVNMFNGWDADVILPDLKIAILWNGPWHFRKCNKKHSVLQVQNRDKIKIDEIRKYGFNEYIISDNGKYNYNFVQCEFNKFLDFIAE